MLLWLVASGLLVAAVFVLAIFMVLRLPASVGEMVVARWGGEYVRLYGTSGTLRDGRGALWVRDFSRRDWIPWHGVDWRIDVGWNRLRLDTNLGVVDFTPAGAGVEKLRVTLPPGLLLEGLSHPLAKAHWRGDLGLAADRLRCSWPRGARGLPACEGALQVRWLGAASSILPIAEFGDYRVELTAQRMPAPEWRAELLTERGLVKLSGYARLGERGADYRLVVKGEKAMIGGLDNIAGSAFRKQAGGDEFVFESGR